MRAPYLTLIFLARCFTTSLTLPPQQRQQQQQQQQRHVTELDRLEKVEALLSKVSVDVLGLTVGLERVKNGLTAINEDVTVLSADVSVLGEKTKSDLDEVDISMDEMRTSFTEINSKTKEDMEQFMQQFISITSPPLGTIVPWTDRPAKGLNGMTVPVGWQLCDGSLITSGPWKGHRTPDLNGKELFIRGSAKFEEVLSEEEDALQDHKHVDKGHVHTMNAHSHGVSENKAPFYTKRDGGLDYLDHKGGGGEYYAFDWNTASATSTMQSAKTGIEGVTNDYRKAHETRPKNVRLLYIMKTSSNDRTYKEEPLLLFLIGGKSAGGKAEVIDLGGEACSVDVADYPGARYGSTGIFINNVAIVCGGGTTGATDVAECYGYDFNGGSWTQVSSMLQSRSFSASVQLSPDTWWITGGQNEHEPLSSTELFDAYTGIFSEYVDLPEELTRHHLLKVNDTHVMLLGNPNKSWMFRQTDKTWHRLPDLLVPTDYACAGLVKTPEGKFEVVVVAGLTTSAVQIFSSDTQTWRRAGDFPAGHLSHSRCVTEGQFFFVVGGEVDKVAQDSIWRYDAGKDTFALLPQKLQRARYAFAAFPLPSGIHSSVCP